MKSFSKKDNSKCRSSRLPSLKALVGCLLFICLFFPGTGICQSSSSSQPSGLAIRQKILALRQARLERELNVVSRCLKQAQLQLRDINGNINRVASTDLINCGRQLRQVQRKLASLGREAAALSRRAEAQAFLLESLIQRRAALARISAASGR